MFIVKSWGQPIGGPRVQKVGDQSPLVPMVVAPIALKQNVENIANTYFRL